jgi:hypothetical protein
VKKLFNYVYCMTLLMVSGNPAVKNLGFDTLIILLFGLGAILFITRPIYLTGRNAILIIALGFLLLTHMVLFGAYVMPASVGFMLQVLTAFMVMSAIPQFMSYFVRCMFVVALVSLFFYFVIMIPGNSDSMRPLLVYEEPIITQFSIGIHTFRGYDKELRNSGPFWEPGAYAGYLALALFCMVLMSENKRQSVIVASVLITALLTTLSTMGYAAFFVVIFAYFIQRFRSANILLVALGFPLVSVFLGFGAYQVGEQIPFLKEKIVEQFDDADEGKNNAEINRFGNAEYDWSFVKRRPFFGWSANVDTRVTVDPTAQEVLKAQGNALTGVAARFGIVGWLLLMGSFFLGFYRASGSLLIAGIGLGLLAAMFTGEKYMNYPFIMTMMFLERHHVITNELVIRRRRRKRGRMGRGGVFRRFGKAVRSTRRRLA